MEGLAPGLRELVMRKEVLEQSVLLFPHLVHPLLELLLISRELGFKNECGMWKHE